MHAGQPKAEWSEPAHISTFSASVPAGADETKESSAEPLGPFVLGRFQISPHRANCSPTDGPSSSADALSMSSWPCLLS